MKKLLLFSLFALLASAMGWATTETWVKVTSTPESWDGDYLIVYEGGNLAFNGSLSPLSEKNQDKKNIEVQISNNTISLDDAYCFTIKKTEKSGQYAIISKSGLQIGHSGSKNTLSTGDNYTNTLSIDKSGNAIITCCQTPTYTLKYNTQTPRFSYYTKGQNAITLYKKQEAPATKVAPLEISPAIGDLPKGTEVTISCATEGAVLNGTVGETTLTGQALPYTFTASVLGDLKVEVKASKEGLEDSEPLTGTYNVYQPKVEALKITPGFGTIEVGTVVTISCATERAVLNGTVGETTLAGQALPYTFTASEVGTINVKVSATKEEYDESDLLDGEFTVKAAAAVAYKDVITADVIKEKSKYLSIDYNTKEEPVGALYNICSYATNDYLQFNSKKATETDASKLAYTGVVMKVSQASPAKIVINWNKRGKGLMIYGKNTPYTSTQDLYDDNKGNLIATVDYSAEGPSTIVNADNYTYIGIVPYVDGAVYVTSFEFIWGEGAAGGADVTYTKASEAKAGNFAVLATAGGKAVGRNADLSPVNVTVSDDAIGLAKGQTAIDEFEIKENGNNYQLYGGLASNGSRRYLTYYDATGVTTVATADDNANVTFEPFAAGLLVKFNDGQYLMFNGTKFIKADYGGTLTPVIVFMSSSNVSTGVETVEADENAEAQYFNLNGVQVKAENLTPGLYIVRQGNKVSKQVIR